MISSTNDIHVEKKKSRLRSKFTKEDDQRLRELINTSSFVDWTAISSQMGNKSARQCRERWQNYLDPRLTKAKWTTEEDQLILAKYEEFGPRWNAIARMLKNRSGNCTRNRFYAIIRHKLNESSQNIQNISADIDGSKQPNLPQLPVQYLKLNSNSNDFHFIDLDDIGQIPLFDTFQTDDFI